MAEGGVAAGGRAAGNIAPDAERKREVRIRSGIVPPRSPDLDICQHSSGFAEEIIRENIGEAVQDIIAVELIGILHPFVGGRRRIRDDVRSGQRKSQIETWAIASSIARIAKF